MAVAPFPFETLPRLSLADLALGNAAVAWLGAVARPALGAQLRALGLEVAGWRLAAVTRRTLDSSTGLVWLTRDGERALLSLPGELVRAQAARLLAGPKELGAPRTLTAAEHAVAAMLCASALAGVSGVAQGGARSPGHSPVGGAHSVHSPVGGAHSVAHSPMGGAHSPVGGAHPSTGGARSPGHSPVGGAGSPAHSPMGGAHSPVGGAHPSTGGGRSPAPSSMGGAHSPMGGAHSSTGGARSPAPSPAGGALSPAGGAHSPMGVAPSPAGGAHPSTGGALALPSGTATGVIGGSNARTGRGSGVARASGVLVETWQPFPDVRSALAAAEQRIAGWPCLELAVEIESGSGAALDGREHLVRLWLPPSLIHRRPLRREAAPWLEDAVLHVALVAATAPLDADTAARLEERDVIVVDPRCELRLGRGAVAVRCEGGDRFGAGAARLMIESGYRRRVPSVNAPSSLAPSDALDDVTAELTVTLGSVALSLRQLTELSVGQVLSLGRPLAGPFELHLGGKPIGRGELVDVEGSLGVRVVSLQPGL